MKDSSKKYGVIYKIMNKTSNKGYIGQTIRSLDSRWTQHCNNAKFKKTAIGKPATWNHCPVVATNIKTNESFSFYNITEAAQKLECLRTSISNALAKGTIVVKKTWTFKYSEVSIG